MLSYRLLYFEPSPPQDFPELALFYQEEVINRGARMISSMLERGVARAGREFGERGEDEAAQVKARVRQRQQFRPALLRPVEQEV